MDYLNMNPYHVAGERGPKRRFTKEESGQRYILLRRMAALRQRRKRLTADYPDKLLVEARIEEREAATMLEIAKVGGIPKRWLERLVLQG